MKRENKMTPDQQFKRWIKWAMACFILVFGYFLLADIKMPLTPQAMATRVVTKMAPPFELAVEQARLALDQAEQQNRQLDATLNAAAADFSSLQTQTAQKQREAERIDTLYRRHMVSEQQKDDADSAARTARANLLASQARMEQARVNRQPAAQARQRGHGGFSPAGPGVGAGGCDRRFSREEPA